MHPYKYYYPDSKRQGLNDTHSKYNANRPPPLMGQCYKDSNFNNYNGYDNTKYRFNNYYQQRGVKRQAQSDWSSSYRKRLNTDQSSPYQPWNYDGQPRRENDQFHQRSKFSGPYKQYDRNVNSYRQVPKNMKSTNNVQTKTLLPKPILKANKNVNNSNRTHINKSEKLHNNSNINIVSNKPSNTISDKKDKSELKSGYDKMYAKKDSSASEESCLDKAFELIMSRWNQGTKDKYLDYTNNIPYIQAYIKETICGRIRNLLFNKTIDTPEEMVALYRNKNPPETDLVLFSIADGSKNITFEQMSALLLESEDPHQYYETNMKTLLIAGLSNLFSDIKKIQKLQGEDRFGESVESETNDENLLSYEEMVDPKKNNYPKLNHKGIFEFIEAQLPKMLPKFANSILNIICAEEKIKALKSGILSNTKLLTNAIVGKDILNKKGMLKTNSTKTDNNVTKNAVSQQEKTAKLSLNDTNVQLTRSTEVSSIITPSVKETFHGKQINKQEESSSTNEVKEKTINESVKVNCFVETSGETDRPNSINIRATDNKAIATTQQLNIGDPRGVCNIKSTLAENIILATTSKSLEEVQKKKSLTANEHTRKKDMTAKNTAQSIATTKQLSTQKNINDKVNDISITSKDKFTLDTVTGQTSEIKQSATADNSYTNNSKNIHEVYDLTNTESESSPCNITDPYYAKIICHPLIPPRLEMQKFLNNYNKTTVKKHKSIDNLLIIGFSKKEDCDMMLLANQTVIDKSTVFIRGYKLPDIKSNESPDNNSTEAVTRDVNEVVVKIKTEPKSEDQLDDILSQDLEDQITNLLLSIKQEQEEEYGVCKD